MQLISLSVLSSTTHAYTNDNKIMNQSTRFTTINISVKRRLHSNSCATRYTTLSTFYLIQNSLWNLWLLNQSNFTSFQWISSPLCGLFNFQLIKRRKVSLHGWGVFTVYSTFWGFCYDTFQFQLIILVFNLLNVQPFNDEIFNKNFASLGFVQKKTKHN